MEKERGVEKERERERERGGGGGAPMCPRRSIGEPGQLWQRAGMCVSVGLCLHACSSYMNSRGPSLSV